MKRKNLLVLSVLWAVAAVAVLSPGVFAADCPADIAAVTVKDPQVPVEVLEYQVKPLTRCELEAEARGWQQLLKKKVREISHAEIAIIYKDEEIETTKAVEKLEVDAAPKTVAVTKETQQVLKEDHQIKQKLNTDRGLQKEIKIAKKKAKAEGDQIVNDGSAETIKDVKIALVKHASDLLAERTALIDRAHVVLKELKAKGGEIKEYDNYINAVSGIQVDITDAGAVWATATGWLTSEEGGLRWGLNLLQFIVILVATYFLSILAGKATNKALSGSPQLSVLLRKFLVFGVRRLILFVGLFVGLSALEFDLGPILAMVGAAGFVIAFALQNSLSNFASGLLTLFYRPFDIGDMINVAGTLGHVESMNLLSTQLRTPDHQLVTVPNNSIWSDVIVNVTGIAHRRIDLMFGIGYSDDIDKAQAILESIVHDHERVLKDPEPIIKLHELADSSVNFICRPWVRPDDYWDVYWDITREVKRRFDAEGVSIPFPQQDVHLHQV